MIQTSIQINKLKKRSVMPQTMVISLVTDWIGEMQAV